MAFQCKFTNAQGTSCREQERAKSGTCPWTWTLQNDAIFIDQRVATCSGLPEWSSRASRRTRGTRRTQRNAGACSDPVDELLGGPTCGCSPGCGMCSARSVRCAMRQCQAFPTHRLAFLAYQNVWPLASHQTKRAASSAPARSRARAVGPVDTMPTRTARGAHLWRLVHVSRPQAWRTKTRRSCSSVWTTLARRRSCIG
jgi:hypothetical protein